jgi:hypothetical protein
LKICHRVNTLDHLKEISNTDYGVEIDIRYHENNLVLHHDPFNHNLNNPTLLQDFLANYHLQGPIILNVKTEGIEQECINLMNKFNIKNWFFLDLSMPYFVKYALLAEKKTILGFNKGNLAVRFSEYEPLEYALAFTGKSSWVWVDCFSKMPLNKENYSKLKESGFKICLVSPELQGHDISLIDDFKKQLQDNNIQVDAVCSKRVDLW